MIKPIKMNSSSISKSTHTGAFCNVCVHMVFHKSIVSQFYENEPIAQLSLGIHKTGLCMLSLRFTESS